MNEAIETDQAAALMAIFEEVAAGGRGLAHLTCYLVSPRIRSLALARREITATMVS